MRQARTEQAQHYSTSHFPDAAVNKLLWNNNIFLSLGGLPGNKVTAFHYLKRISHYNNWICHYNDFLRLTLMKWILDRTVSIDSCRAIDGSPTSVTVPTVAKLRTTSAASANRSSVQKRSSLIVLLKKFHFRTPPCLIKVEWLLLFSYSLPEMCIIVCLVIFRSDT